MSKYWQNIILAIVGIIVATFIWTLQPTVLLSPHGILLPQASPLAKISPENVKIYTQTPKDALTLGYIRVVIHFSSTSDAANNANFLNDVHYAQTLAANYGANGLVIQAAGPTSGGVSPLDGFELFAIAVYTPIPLAPIADQAS